MFQYLLEIGCEELPAAFIPKSAEYLKSETDARLKGLNIPFTSIRSSGTPRRIYLLIEGLAEKQEDKSELVMGPPAGIAFEKNGEISQVGLKFAQSKGLNVDSLKKVTTPKGEYLQGEKKTGGGDAASLLQSLIPELIKSIPFAKSMKWGAGDFKFGRPIHSFLSILNGQVLPFEVGGIAASNITYGHRFLAPQPITIKSFDEYKTALSAAFVIIDTDERKEIIKQQLAEIAESKSVKIEADEELLNTVANILEYPHAIAGAFDEDFLKLPTEVLVTSMKINQKYFPVKDKNDKLLNMFVGVANIAPVSGDDVIRQGYERVLRARLNDAAFFFANDKNVPLEKRTESLKNVVYQAKLGSVYEKVIRMQKAAVYFAELLAPEIIKDVEEAAFLAKADLMSEMVYEFPELQGIMGYYYAKIQGKSENVCLGIREHYLPKFAGDCLPSTDEGAIVSIADKLDTICGAFAASMIPTGNLDPYGLRRCAIGILAIIENSDFRIDLKKAVQFCLTNLKQQLVFDENETLEKILTFIMQRMKQIVISRGDADGEIFEAVSGKSFDPTAVSNLAKVISSAKGSENFQIIAESFKRINNILKKSDWNNGDYSKTVFNTSEETAIAQLIENQKIGELVEKEKNYEALDELMKFAPAVNAFFANVMVMADDKAVRENRLCLLFALRNVFLNVGNFDGISS